MCNVYCLPSLLFRFKEKVEVTEKKWQRKWRTLIDITKSCQNCTQRITQLQQGGNKSNEDLPPDQHPPTPDPVQHPPIPDPEQHPLTPDDDRGGYPMESLSLRESELQPLCSSTQLQDRTFIDLTHKNKKAKLHNYSDMRQRKRRSPSKADHDKDTLPVKLPSVDNRRLVDNTSMVEESNTSVNSKSNNSRIFFSLQGQTSKKAPTKDKIHSSMPTASTEKLVVEGKVNYNKEKPGVASSRSVSGKISNVNADGLTKQYPSLLSKGEMSFWTSKDTSPLEERIGKEVIVVKEESMDGPMSPTLAADSPPPVDVGTPVSSKQHFPIILESEMPYMDTEMPYMGTEPVPFR